VATIGIIQGVSLGTPVFVASIGAEGQGRGAFSSGSTSPIMKRTTARGAGVGGRRRTAEGAQGEGAGGGRQKEVKEEERGKRGVCEECMRKPCV